jgi:hypothetical protein
MEIRPARIADAEAACAVHRRSIVELCDPGSVARQQDAGKLQTLD